MGLRALGSGFRVYIGFKAGGLGVWRPILQPPLNLQVWGVVFTSGGGGHQGLLLWFLVRAYRVGEY